MRKRRWHFGATGRHSRTYLRHDKLRLRAHNLHSQHSLTWLKQFLSSVVMRVTIFCNLSPAIMATTRASLGNLHRTMPSGASEASRLRSSIGETREKRANRGIGSKKTPYLLWRDARGKSHQWDLARLVNRHGHTPLCNQARWSIRMMKKGGARRPSRATRRHTRAPRAKLLPRRRQGNVEVRR